MRMEMGSENEWTIRTVQKEFSKTDIKQQGWEQESTCVILGSQLKSQARPCKQL